MAHSVGVFHTPAVVQQEAEQAEQDEGHASQYGQQEHGVVRADVLQHRTCQTDRGVRFWKIFFRFILLIYYVNLYSYGT